MRFVIGGRVIEINTIHSLLDKAFISLHASYFGHEALNLADFDVAAIQFFTDNPDNISLQDAYFGNFSLIWNSFLNSGSYDEAERIWSIALSPALMWEQSNPGKFIHKGTPYYFWGTTALLRGDLDKGYVLMHRAVKEDVRTNNKIIPDTPSYALVSLNYEKVDQAFLQWVQLQAEYLGERQKKYSTTYGRAFTLVDFKHKFLEAPPSTDVTFLFAYTVARMMKLISLPQHALQSDFVAQIEANLLFDVALVIDAAIKAKNNGKKYFIDHAEYISMQAGQPLTNDQLREINSSFNNDFDNTLAKMTAGTFTLPNGNALLQFQADVAIAYGLRNLGAHNVAAVPTISEHFQEVEQALLNVLFAVVDHLY